MKKKKKKKLPYQCFGVTWVKLMTSSRISFFAFSNSSFCAKWNNKIKYSLIMFPYKRQKKSPTVFLRPLGLKWYHLALFWTMCVHIISYPRLPYLFPHLLHASVKARHFSIQDLYKRIRKWDPNCFATLSERPGNATSLCQLYNDHKETLTIPGGKLGQVIVH